MIRLIFPAVTLCLGASLLSLPTEAAPTKKEQAYMFYEHSYTSAAQIKTRSRALAEINRALQLDPNNALYWRQKGNIINQMEESEEALPLIEKSLELDPKDALTWRFKAEILDQLGRQQEAIKCADKSWELGKLPNAIMVKAECYFHMKLLAQSERELDKYIRMFPDDPIARERRLKVYLVQRKWQQAIGDATVILDKHKNRDFTRSKVINDRATAYLELKQYKKAEEDIMAGIKFSPDYRPYHVSLLRLYEATGNKAAALRERANMKKFDNDVMSD